MTNDANSESSPSAEPKYDYSFQVWPNEIVVHSTAIYDLFRMYPRIEFTLTEAAFHKMEAELGAACLTLRDIERRPHYDVEAVAAMDPTHLLAPMIIEPPPPMSEEARAKITELLEKNRLNPTRWEIMPRPIEYLPLSPQKQPYDFWGPGGPPLTKEVQLDTLARIKEDAVADQDFDKAAAARDQHDLIKKGKALPSPAGIDFIRVGGDAVCPACHKKYYDHAKDGPPGPDGRPFLVRMCDGRLAKL